MIVKPSNNASKRTKNRLAENGPEFNLLDSKSEVFAFGNKAVPGILVKSVTSGWLGWFPTEEVEME